MTASGGGSAGGVVQANSGVVADTGCYMAAAVL
jgi:hypothetical protein